MLRSTRSKRRFAETSVGRPSRRSVMQVRRNSLTRPLKAEPGNTSIVEVHQQRNEQAEAKIKRHCDHHDLYSLSALIENDAGKDLDNVRISDRHRERGALHKAKVLAGKRRNYDSQRLQIGRASCRERV